MGKLIRALARSQELEVKRQQGIQQAAIDPSKLDFCRVLYDYNPPTQAAGIDLAVKRGDLVAVLSRTDPMGNASEWWRCRSRDGAVGYLPSPYLETIQRRSQQQAITAGSAPGSRTNTLVGGGEEQRTKSLSSVSALKNENSKRPEVKGKMGDISPESFQKSTFYS
jgi:peroxin-13